ncbi:SLC13 family permease [Haloferax sp. MBLA0078]|uniref:SLC13 family permease n=1 Tax=Haloferax marinum TaxID=2666143 RepID=A0A6A8G789_9EURY|nr:MULTISPECIES: SLC13 family permease [Haloferax]KAB1198957.1 sodium-coupled transporter [Haloferax sp. CBA1150]MRW97150.1 SLC13 family permease [Haloferax marinum]
MPVVTFDILVVFGLVLAAVVLFATEALSPDITAISVIVAVVILEPWTGIGTETAFVGFANTATITVAAMYMLSEGIHRTGIVRRLKRAIASVSRDSETRLLGSTLVLTGGMAGIVNNTPIVAVFIPMVTDLAEKYQISPSKLLMPLSYAAMLGGTLTLVGTSTNLLASTFSERLLDRPFSMFEFTHLGVLVLVVGIAYLMTVGRRLVPTRVEPTIDLLGAFELRKYITRLYVRENSPLVGRTFAAAIDDLPPEFDEDIDVIEVVRADGRYAAPGPEFELDAEDVLTVRADRHTARKIASAFDLWPLPWVRLSELDLSVPASIGTLVEVRVPSASDLAGQRVDDIRFRQRYGATILAVRRGSDIIRERFEDVVLEVDDELLVRTAGDNVDVLRDPGNIVVTAVTGEGVVEPRGSKSPEYREAKAPLAIAIVGGVVLAAATGFVSIGISALAGVVAMIVGGALEPQEAYDAVSWDVIFLLAGMIPLGIALENSGGATFVAEVVVVLAGALPVLAVVGLFYLVTAVMTNLISNNATVALLIPIAVDVAAQLDANAFAFVLAVTFAASTSFLTPIGYQTNLMVYGPGGYEFTDFLRVGAPLQLLLTVVTTLGIWVFWGV